MPKLVDYSVRFDFLRQAAFEVVLRNGPGGLAALSRRSLAAALGSSVNTVRRLLAEEAELVLLAAGEVEQRRRRGRWTRVRDVSPGEAAVSVLRTCLPDSEERVAEELVWLRLHVATTSPPVDRDRDGLLLRERFRIYEVGYLDDEDAQPAPAPAPVPAPASAMAPLLAEREAAVSAAVDDALDVLACPEPERAERQRLLRALLAGLTLRVCLGETAPAEAVELLARTVRPWATARVAE